MKHFGTIPLHSQRLILRRYTLDDVDAMYENWASDPRASTYVSWETHKNKEATRDIIQVWMNQYASDHFYHWGIEMDHELIGDIGVTSGSQQHEHAEIGYCLSPKHWNRGIMTEALGRVLHFMLDGMELHRVYARHDVLNVASSRVMEKNGMVYEGTQREHYRRKDGTFANLAMYGILRSEWSSTHSYED